MINLIFVAYFAIVGLVFTAPKVVGGEQLPPMYEMVNQERLSAGLPILERDPKLEEIATKRACEIKEWSHKGWEKYVENAGYTFYGENLARNYNDDQTAMIALMNSPKHKDNILGKFRKVGIGHCGIYIVQHFGGDQWNQ